MIEHDENGPATYVVVRRSDGAFYAGRRRWTTEYPDAVTWTSEAKARQAAAERAVGRPGVAVNVVRHFGIEERTIAKYDP